MLALPVATTACAFHAPFTPTLRREGSLLVWRAVPVARPLPWAARLVLCAQATTSIPWARLRGARRAPSTRTPHSLLLPRALFVLRPHLCVLQEVWIVLRPFSSIVLILVDGGCRVHPRVHRALLASIVWVVNVFNVHWTSFGVPPTALLCLPVCLWLWMAM